MEMATTSQIQKLHVLLKQLQMIDDKKEIITGLTRGRTESSKELSLKEARYLIGRLVELDPMERLRQIISQLAFRAGITYGSTPEDQKINSAKLDLFLKAKGTVKKDLYQHTYPELVKTHRQFEAICKGVSQSKNQREAYKAVYDLLKELDLKIK